MMKNIQLGLVDTPCVLLNFISFCDSDSKFAVYIGNIVTRLLSKSLLRV